VAAQAPLAGRGVSRRRAWARGGLLWWAVMLALATGSASVAYGAFATRVQNTANRITAGTVVLSENDGGQAMLSLANAALGASDTSCIRTSYGGTLPSSVRHYATVTGALAPDLTLRVTRGSGAGTFDSCTGFSADAANYIGAGAGVIYDGKLSGYPTSTAAAIVDPSDTGGPETWSAGETHDYKFQITLDNDPAASGLAATATFTWEAASQ
jgi:hypothetical protein